MRYTRSGILGVTIAALAPLVAFAQMPGPSLDAAPSPLGGMTTIVTPIPADTNILVPAPTSTLPIGIPQPYTGSGSVQASTPSRSCVPITRNLSFGSRVADVIQLQQYLISQGLLTADSATGYFGKLTEAAVQQWQSSHDIVSSGSPVSTGYGAVGPQTRAALAAACAGQSTTVPTSANVSTFTYTPSVSTNANQSAIDALLAQIQVLQQKIAALLAAKRVATVPPTTTVVIPSASCSFGGQSIQSGTSVIAYQSSSVAYGSQCASELRVCTNGTLSGSYANASCSVGTAASCVFNGQTISNGSSVLAYQSSSVAYGSQCTSQTRTCTNGTLSGSYPYGACSVGGAASCTLDSVNVVHNASQTFYSSRTVPFGSSCSSVSQSRTCGNGTLSGDAQYQYGVCTVGTASSCVFNGQTISNGSSVLAYQSTSVAYGSQCTSQSRTCSNGSLSGSYQYASCIAGTPASCTWNGQTIAHGTNVTAYQTSSVSFGQSCLSQTRTCTNGSLSGSYQYPSCSANAPVSCTWNGQTVQNGSSVTAYQSSSVPAGSQCVSETRVCNNGSLSGSYTNASCSAAQFAPEALVIGSPAIAIQNSSINLTQLPPVLQSWQPDPLSMIDSSISTFRVGGTHYWLNSNAFYTAKFSGDVNDPFATQVWNTQTKNVFQYGGYDDMNGVEPGYWIVNTYQAQDGILAFVHVEYGNESNPSASGVMKIGIAWSSDNGDHFRYLGDILSPYGNPTSDKFNIQGAPYVIKDGYFYLYYSDVCGNTVARAPIADVISAARAGKVTIWNKYYNDGFNGVGLGGLCNGVVPTGITHSDAAYSTYTGKYYLVLSQNNGYPPAAVHPTWLKLYSSADGLSWSLDGTIVEEPATASLSGYQYVTIADVSGSDNGIVGQKFYVYSAKVVNHFGQSAVYRWLVDLGGQAETMRSYNLFSSTQGKDGWRYQYTASSDYSDMTWDAANARWKGNEDYLLWGRGWGHPGAASDSVLTWIASRAETVQITGIVSDANTECGDGVAASIKKNGTTLWQASLANGDTVGKSHLLTVNVSAGDAIHFVLDKRSDNACDSTIWDPTVAYQ